MRLFELVGQLLERLELFDVDLERFVVLLDGAWCQSPAVPFNADGRETNVLELHVALGEFFEHILRFSRNVELRAQVFDFGFGGVELDGHVVEIACVLVKSDSLGDHESWRGRTLQVCSEVDLFLEVLDLALHLVLVLAGQVSQSARKPRVSQTIILGAEDI